MATDYGRDLWCRDTLVSTREAKGIDIVINALVRRILTTKGTLTFHPDYGVDEISIGDEWTPGLKARAEYAYRMACEADPRVTEGSVRVVITPTVGPNRTDLEIAISGRSSLGPFAFVTTIDKVTLDLIGVRKETAT